MARHPGEWVSVRARAERLPPRFTLTITVGGLPEGWDRARRRKAARIWAAGLGVIMIAPFLALAAAGALHAAGLGAPYSWIAANPPAIVAASVSLFIGLPIAFVINAWPITRLGVRRLTGELEGLVAVEIAPLHLFIAGAALVLGSLFAGHLAADSYACISGVHSAC